MHMLCFKEGNREWLGLGRYMSVEGRPAETTKGKKIRSHPAPKFEDIEEYTENGKETMHRYG